ncbi:hypothetical protein CPAR01_05031 [Colletotrichum paranaense]|uniref:Secreted protein n=1 Tax=Colletotrichum paranaense TaxID=1914294 RepID=A0ABQ9SR05_9PEZI|nr:uncharacterized protein CPAR01_05031 [Colletotrichum paranaense]KAK1541644.1 hypothetical protein CPAR01_05031 [Colletotrichum paranaense]
MVIISAIVPPLICYIAAGSLTRELTDKHGHRLQRATITQSRKRPDHQAWVWAHGDSAVTSQQRGEGLRKQCRTSLKQRLPSFRVF